MNVNDLTCSVILKCKIKSNEKDTSSLSVNESDIEQLINEKILPANSGCIVKCISEGVYRVSFRKKHTAEKIVSLIQKQKSNEYELSLNEKSDESSSKTENNVEIEKSRIIVVEDVQLASL